MSNKQTKTTVTLRVKFTLPEDATLLDAANYVREAVQSWRGSLPSDITMVDLDPDTVTVVLHEAVKRTTYA